MTESKIGNNSLLEGWHPIPHTLPPIFILSLDGGGIRGLSEVIMLKHLVDSIDKTKTKYVRENDSYIFFKIIF